MSCSNLNNGRMVAVQSPGELHLGSTSLPSERFNYFKSRNVTVFFFAGYVLRVGRFSVGVSKNVGFNYSVVTLVGLPHRLILKTWSVTLSKTSNGPSYGGSNSFLIELTFTKTWLQICRALCLNGFLTE